MGTGSIYSLPNDMHFASLLRAFHFLWYFSPNKQCAKTGLSRITCPINIDAFITITAIITAITYSIKGLGLILNQSPITLKLRGKKK